MKHPSRNVSRFTQISFLIFLCGTISVVTLDLAEGAGLISKVAESVARLVVWSSLLAILVYLALRANIAPQIQNVVIFLVLMLACMLVLSLTDDIRALDDVAVLGRNGAGHVVVTKLLAAIWTCTGFWLVYMLLKSAADSHNQLESRVAQRTKELRQSNEQLRVEIEQRQAIQVALDETNKILEMTSVERTLQLQDALDQLKAAQQKVIRHEQLSALGRMASGIAHELNNTLSPIVAYSQMLERQPKADRQQDEWTASISQAASDAIRVVRQLQQFYRPNEATPCELVDLRSILEQVSSRTRPKWKDASEQHGQSIDLDMALHDVPTIMGNAVELRQLFNNLVLNAIDALPKGGVITIRLHEQGDEVVASVSDTGKGMVGETLQRCFEPFFSTKHDGVGMGLSICHGVVQRHGGQMDIETRAGEGTSFITRFPACREVAAGPNPSLDQPAESLVAQRVLCIDDDETVRHSVMALLETLGAEVSEAADGPSGLALLETREFDVVITDLGMAEMDGRKVVSAIKLQFPNLPVILMSGWSAAEVADQFQDQAAPDHIIEKPATLETIDEALRRSCPCGSADRLA